MDSTRTLWPCDVVNRVIFSDTTRSVMAATGSSTALLLVTTGSGVSHCTGRAAVAVVGAATGAAFHAVVLDAQPLVALAATDAGLSADGGVFHALVVADAHGDAAGWSQVDWVCPVAVVVVEPFVFCDCGSGADGRGIGFQLDKGLGAAMVLPPKTLPTPPDSTSLVGVGCTRSSAGTAFSPLFHWSAVSAAVRANVFGYRSCWNSLHASLRGTVNESTSQTPLPPLLLALRLSTRATSHCFVSHACLPTRAAASVVCGKSVWLSL
jgi:hypothetical protein